MDSNNTAVYFAYGTLLDIDEMTRFCPSAKSLGLMKLLDHKLKFSFCKKNSDNGGCNLESFPGNVMYGILYELPEQELRDLDRLSGHGEGLWTNMHINLVNEKGKTIPALTYVIPTPGGDFTPSDDYVRPILKGLEVLPIPDEYKGQVRQIIHDATNK
ncbi:MAG: gamma-glutamylcyclotransferase [Desulfobacula sp.]|nr:gamma-glutamylcyclotransferase [Nitrospina sp.]MBT5547060.1 gamma-glutamylcyclotransferase [Desulfobacula sp.]